MPSGSLGSSDVVVAPRVGIIGAGLSGVAVAIFMRDKVGFEDSQMIGIERWEEVGGTWFVSKPEQGLSSSLETDGYVDNSSQECK